MRYDDYDDDDLPLRRPSGVAGGWRVAAVCAFAFATIFGALLVVMTIVLIDRQRPVPQHVPQWQPMLPPQQVPQQPAVNNNNDPDANVDPKTLPYPLQQDLRPFGVFAAPPDEPPARQQSAARERFLRAGAVVWTNDELVAPETVLIAPDGETIAYGSPRGVIVGAPGAVRLVTGTQPGDPAPVGPKGAAAPPRPLVTAWSVDGGALYWAAPDGTLGTVPAGAAESQPLAAGRARCAVPLPPLNGQLVVVRHRPRAKVDAPLRSAPADPSEVVVFDPDKKATRILIPAGNAVWRAPAVSPDGRRLALVSDSGHESNPLRLWRVFVLDVAGGEPRPLTPPAMAVGSACWAPDGKTLVYDRGPPAGDEVAPLERFRADLFEVDPATGRESPLSVGGGFSSPSVSRKGDLFYLAKTAEQNTEKTELMRLPLAKARQLATGEGGRLTAKAWSELTAAALREAGLPPDVRAPALDEEAVKKLAAAFTKGYRDRFGADLPDTAAELDRLRGEERSLRLLADERARVSLVMGAVEGEYLRRKHGARWALKVKPAGPPLATPAVDELFRHVVNPFRDFWFRDPDGEEPGFNTLALVLSQAEGRPLVLADAAAVRSHVPAADPDLGRGLALLKEGQGDEADKLLLAMTQRHAANYHLALHVGAVLGENGRKEALRTLVKRLNVDQLKDARAYNLQGVSLLEDEPQAALTAFRNALRCNLYHAPSYFNLALTYEKLGEVPTARRCLQRYLRLMSYAPQAEDARRRLAELPADAAGRQ
jgi:tetratricopeptide (TPR) repeat protein